jgi:hypothetical protein
MPMIVDPNGSGKCEYCFAAGAYACGIVEPEKRFFAANVYLQDELRGVHKVHAA